VLSAADEVAVEAFIAGRIRFPDISAIVEETIERHPIERADSIETIMAADAWARDAAANLVARRSPY
jgi:1-deoxy-D-xylulose-5-phosphate reductoisomerase